MRFGELTAQECRDLMTAKAYEFVELCRGASRWDWDKRNGWRATLIKEIAELNEREMAAREQD